MRTVRRVVAALVMAGTMAGGMGTAVMDAERKKPTPPKEAICQYLASLLAYPYLDPAIRQYVWWLYHDIYKCDA